MTTKEIVAIAGDATSEVHRNVVEQLVAAHDQPAHASVFPGIDPGQAQVYVSTAGPLPGALLTVEVTPEIRASREAMLNGLLGKRLDAPCTCRKKKAGCVPHETRTALKAVLDGAK
jgi:hypothetical protein